MSTRMPKWLEDALGDPMAQPEPYQKGLSVTVPLRAVYAQWLPCMAMICGEPIPANRWVVWWADTVPPVFEVLFDGEFGERFVLESQAPEHMRQRFTNMPSYGDWVAMHNQEGTAQ